MSASYQDNTPNTGYFVPASITSRTQASTTQSGSADLSAASASASVSASASSSTSSAPNQQGQGSSTEAGAPSSSSSSSQQSTQGGSTRQLGEEARKDKTLAEFLLMLDDYEPLVSFFFSVLDLFLPFGPFGGSLMLRGMIYIDT